MIQLRFESQKDMLQLSWYEKQHLAMIQEKSVLIFGLNSSHRTLNSLSSVVPSRKKKQDPWLAGGVYRSGFSLVDNFFKSSLEGWSPSKHFHALGWNQLLTWDQISWLPFSRETEKLTSDQELGGKFTSHP